MFLEQKSDDFSALFCSKNDKLEKFCLSYWLCTIPSTAARWSAHLPDHLPKSSSFLIKRAAKSTGRKMKNRSPPLNPPMGDFFRMSLCNVSLLPLYFSSDFSIRVLTCIIQHGQKANRVKMNGYAALSAFCPCCIFYARKPR